MGVLSFRFSPPELARTLPDLRKAYVTGQDRMPGRGTVEVRPGLLICHRESPESGRLHVPWPVPGFGMPFTATATLAERNEPYDLSVELARGRLNDVRNQHADWTMMGLESPAELTAHLRRAQHAFGRAVTAGADHKAADAAALESLAASFQAGAVLVGAYTEQVLRKRKEFGSKLPTLLSCALDGDAKSLRRPEGINGARIACNWAKLAPTEGKFRWDEFDAQLAFCRSERLTPTAGPLLDLRPGAVPDWIWLWQGDFDEIQGMALDLVRQTLSRYKNKVAVWHLVARPGSGEVLGLSEEEQIRLTAKILQVARQIDHTAQFVVDFDRPWAEWLGSSPFQLGPLHLADSLARAELGLAGVGIEIAPGYSSPGSHMRDLLDLSKLLDLYALVNLPLHVTLVMPSATSDDPQAEGVAQVEPAQWPRPPDEALQNDFGARWFALAVAKPFVRSVTWLQESDARRHIYPHGGLLRPDLSPKPLTTWLKGFRESYLE